MLLTVRFVDKLSELVFAWNRSKIVGTCRNILISCYVLLVTPNKRMLHICQQTTPRLLTPNKKSNHQLVKHMLIWFFTKSKFLINFRGQIIECFVRLFVPPTPPPPPQNSWKTPNIVFLRNQISMFCLKVIVSWTACVEFLVDFRFLITVGTNLFRCGHDKISQNKNFEYS